MKVWLFSDSHEKHGLLNVPNGIDLALFAGDCGGAKNPYMNSNGVQDFLFWYKLLPIKHKVFIPGNHDTSIEKGLIDMSQYKNDFLYLNHEYGEIAGLKLFGSPYTPEFNNWAYGVRRDRLHDYWKDIPQGLDFLITHGPPKGILDLTYAQTGGHSFQCGDRALLNAICEKKPKYHVFGHIHPESDCFNAGILRPTGMETTFINAAVLNLRYDIDNHGVVIEI